jgi:putative ABC transport system permease protein
MMIIKQIVRGLKRDWLNTSVIVVSLAVGIACSTLIALFISTELGADNFHKNADRIFLLKCDDPFNKDSKISVCRAGGAEYMKLNYSQVEDFCRINETEAQSVSADGQTYYDHPLVIEASDNFFKFFSYELLTNNADEVLKSKDAIVISEELANKYFGKSAATGRIITLATDDNKVQYVVNGVFKKPTSNSALSFDMVKKTGASEQLAFLLLRKGVSASELEKNLVKDKEKIPVIYSVTPGFYSLERLKDVYFDASVRGSFVSTRNRSDLWLAFVIGLAVLITAVVNYIGLLNNKLRDKTSGYTIRLINGGSKVRLVKEFMTENLIILLLSFIAGIVLTLLSKPFFSSLVDSKGISAGYLMPHDILIMIFTALFFIIVALIFTLMKTTGKVDVSHLKVKVTGSGKATNVPAFSIIQIAVTIVLFICSYVILKQIRYITHKDIGVDKAVIEVRLPIQYGIKAHAFKEELLVSPAVSLVSVAGASPLQDHWSAQMDYNENGRVKEYVAAMFNGDENYINTLGLTLLEGRNFNGAGEADKSNCIINQSLAELFPGQDMIGRKLPGDESITVIGIVKDFNYTSLKNIVAPGYISYSENGCHLLVKPSQCQVNETRMAIAEVWKKLIPDYPLDIESIGERYLWYHRENEKYGMLTGSCCIISLFLSMIGLFTVSYNSSKKRTREIGIRKVNGATIANIFIILNRDFFKWTAFALTVAIPVAWCVMQKWLEGFAYKTGLSWWIFAVAGAFVLTVTLLTVSYQSIKAAVRNPVEAIRYE